MIQGETLLPFDLLGLGFREKGFRVEKQGIYWGYVGIMEKSMEATTITRGYIWGSSGEKGFRNLGSSSFVGRVGGRMW